MTITQFFQVFALLTLANSATVESSQTNNQICLDDSQPRSTTFWTDWYSSNGSLTSEGESENFTQVCSGILETECREKYTHRSLAETGLSFAIPCEDGVLLCNNFRPNNTCGDMEMRLNCTTPHDALREADFHWSLSELDTGNTRGAIESWNCAAGNNRQLVQQVAPIRGNLFGYVREGEGLDKRYSYASLITRCGVRTNGLSSLSFEPFVRSCLTDLTCCNSDGITVSFWFRKDEMQNNEPSPQTVPLHVFRSPYLLITMQEGNLTATYHNGSKTTSVRAEIEDSIWRFVTVTYDTVENITVYINEAEVGEMVPDSSQWVWSSLEEFETLNTSFQVFTTAGSVNVTSSDIRPIAISELKIFYYALSHEDVQRQFATQQDEDLPGKVIRMWTSRKQYRDNVTQNEVQHIWLECLMRVHEDKPFTVRFMYRNDDQHGHFQEMTSDIFKMRTYLKHNNVYRTLAVALIFGRHDGGALPKQFTCDLFTDSQVSGYGYEIIGIQSSVKIVESTYYWTKFFDNGPPTSAGDEDESKTVHQTMAHAEGYYLLCDNPVYAECRVKALSSGDALIPWYDASLTFVPEYNYPCDRRGIRCSTTDPEGNAQTCPDLVVRYACKTPTADTAPDTAELSFGDEPTVSSSTFGQPSNVSNNTSQVGPGVGNAYSPSNNNSNSSGLDAMPPSGGQQSGGPSGGNTKNSFTKAIKDNLNWIYPVIIVVLGVGVPILISCYFLFRKKTPEEIEAEAKKLAASIGGK